MKYAELPVYAYQTYDPATMQYRSHPIVPRERILFSEHRFAEGRSKNGSMPPSAASSIRSSSPAISHDPSESHEALRGVFVYSTCAMLD